MQTIVTTASYFQAPRGDVTVLVATGAMAELVAGSGNDTLISGGGLTQMFGGSGLDQFDVSANGVTNISGFHHGDHIQVPYGSSLLDARGTTEILLHHQVIGFVTEHITHHDLLFA